MNRNKIQIALSVAVIIATTFSSCMDDSYLENGGRGTAIAYQVLTNTAVTRASQGMETPVGCDSTSGGKMRVSVTATAFPEAAMTRGVAVTSPTAITTFGVCAAIYDADGTYTDAGCGSYFWNKEATPNVSSGYFWPTRDYKLSFFAHYPYGSSVFRLSSTADALGRPSYTYTMNDDPRRQVDVMTSEVLDKVPDNETVPLTFTHRTAAVRLLLGAHAVQRLLRGLRHGGLVLVLG